MADPIAIGYRAVFEFTGREEVPKDVVSADIHSSVVMLPRQSFELCQKLMSVRFREGLVVIDSFAFNRCRSLKNAVFPSTVKQINSGAFMLCGELVHVTLPGGIVCLAAFAFARCYKLEEIRIPVTIAQISESTFERCQNLKTVDFSGANSLQLISKSAFEGCLSLESISIPPCTLEVKRHAFKDCVNLSEVHLSECLELERHAFLGCRHDIFRFRSLLRRMAPIPKMNNYNKQGFEHVLKLVGETLVLEKGGYLLWGRCQEHMQLLHQNISIFLEEYTTTLELALWKENIENQDRRQTRRMRLECQAQCGANVVIGALVRQFLVLG